MLFDAARSTCPWCESRCLVGRLDTTDLLVTISSTAALESLHRRIPTVVLTDLGTTFIKFGQIIASSAGMFPDAYVKEFQKVLDRVKPFPFEDVKRTLDEELGAEKAAPLVRRELDVVAGALRRAVAHAAEEAHALPLAAPLDERRAAATPEPISHGARP